MTDLEPRRLFIYLFIMIDRIVYKTRLT